MSHSQGRENDDLNHDQLEFPEHDKKSKNPNHSQSRIKPTKFPNHLKHVEPHNRMASSYEKPLGGPGKPR